MRSGITGCYTFFSSMRCYWPLQSLCGCMEYQRPHQSIDYKTTQEDYYKAAAWVMNKLTVINKKKKEAKKKNATSKTNYFWWKFCTNNWEYYILHIHRPVWYYYTPTFKAFQIFSADFFNWIFSFHNDCFLFSFHNDCFFVFRLLYKFGFWACPLF